MNASLKLSSIAFATCLTGLAHSAPSLQTFAHIGTSNDLQWPNTTSISGQFDPLGGFVEAEGSQEFTGLDRQGDEQTSTFGGHSMATANYGILKTFVTATLSNSFYNSENAANGSPNIYVGAGQATFTDTLHFSGSFVAPTFKVRYVYFIDGDVTGQNAYGALSVSVGAANQSFSMNTGFTGGQYFATDLYELNPNLDHELSTNFLAGFQVDTRFLPDGFNVSGTASFGHTVTLAGIEMFDENNNRVTNFSVTSASGTMYAVPEPSTMIVCGLGIVAAIRRRRKAA